MAQTGDRDPFDDLRSYANGLVDAVPMLDTSSLHLVAGSPIPKRPHRFTVPAMAAMGVAATLLFAEVGVSVAANSAVPGDGIYGIDLLVEDALGAIGIPIDTASERIDEAEVLLERDDLDGAIRAARTGYREMDQAVVGTAIMELVRAENAVSSSTDPVVVEGVRDSVGGLLKATQAAGAIEASDARAIHRAVLRVSQAASLGGEDSP
jgi:hypothetical protein